MHGVYLAFILLLLNRSATAQEYLISTYAGGATLPTPIRALEAPIGAPTALYTDGTDNIYFMSLDAVFKLDRDGIITRVAGNSWVMRRTTSMPFNFGIEMSITATSGRVRSASASALMPSEASATTLHSPLPFSSATSPSRSSVWSSATRTRIGFIESHPVRGQVHAELGARARLGDEL